MENILELVFLGIIAWAAGIYIYKSFEPYRTRKTWRKMLAESRAKKKMPSS